MKSGNFDYSRHLPELTDEQREKLTKLVKVAIAPIIGYLVVKPAYVHKDKMTAYIQYWRSDGGFSVGIQGFKDKVKEMSGILHQDKTVEIQSSNLEEDDIKKVEDILTEAQRRGDFEDNSLQTG